MVDQFDNEVKIIIRYDFKLGDELPYSLAMDALSKKIDFATNCLEFFNTNNLGAVVVKSDGSSIKVSDLLNGSGGYTMKEIRKAHNIHKILLSGGFNWH